jgi:hypothetical protein
MYKSWFSEFLSRPILEDLYLLADQKFSFVELKVDWKKAVDDSYK